MGCRSLLPSWPLRLRVVGSVVVLGIAGGAQLIGAMPVLAGSPATASCVLSGKVTFTPGVTFTSVSSEIGVSISASGSCVSTFPAATSATFTANSLMTMTCEGGVGALGVNINYNSTLPPSASGAASVVAGPESMSLVLQIPGVDADAELAWTSPLSTAACATGGVTSVPVSGTLNVVYS